jgi:hypothetical protein
MYGQDYFSSSLSGELASTTNSGLYVSRVDTGDFLKYFYNSTTTSWTVYDKHGRTYIFGSVGSSRNSDPGDLSRIAKWYLDEVRDANGNFISYSYNVIGGQVYPSQITYTGHRADSGEMLQGIYKVSFIYDSVRPDSAVQSYRLGFLSTNAQRLKTIEIRVSDALSKKYDFSYDVGVNGARTILSGITETGYDSSGGITVLPQTSFEYTKGFENPSRGGGIVQSVSSGTFTWALGSFFYGPERRGDVYADLNGDGFLDSFVLSVNPYSASSFVSNVTWNSLGSVGLGTLPYLRFAYVDRGPNGSTPEDNGARVADFNGDGFNDFIGVPTTIYDDQGCGRDFTCPLPANPPTQYINTASASLTNEYSYNAATTSLGVGPGTFLADFKGIGIPTVETRTVSSWPNDQVSAMDINGDGLDDIKVNDRYTNFKINNGGSPSTFSSTVLAPLDMTDTYGNDMGVRFIDINGDGLVDVLRGWILPADPGYLQFENGYTRENNNDVYLNTGSGFVRSSTLQSPYFIQINPWQWKWC